MVSVLFCCHAALTEPIDIYSEWIDECERVNTVDEDGVPVEDDEAQKMVGEIWFRLGLCMMYDLVFSEFETLLVITGCKVNVDWEHVNEA